jgi:hypothetical protein
MPSKTEGKYTGEFLYSEANGYLSRDTVTALSGQTWAAGDVIGQITVGAGVAAAVAGNTGNGAFSAVVLSQGAIAGVYHLTCIKAVANAGVFDVEDPHGVTVGEAGVGVAYAANGLSFTISDGATDFVVGDQFTITVAAGSGKWVQCLTTAADGSQIAAAISYDNVDATAGDTPAVAIVREAEYNDAEVNFVGMNAGQILTAKAQLAQRNIIARKGL